MKKLFVAMNMDDLSQDVARGSGDYLASMATLMGIDAADHAVFFKLSQSNYETIFSSNTVNYDSVISALNDVLASDARLSQYVARS